MIPLKSEGFPALLRKPPTGMKISCCIDMVEHLGPVHLADRKMLHILTLTNNYMLIDHHLVAVGTVDHCPCHPREIFRYALYDSASCIALVQNHPSGYSTPSQEEIVAADELQDAASILCIPIVRHVIVAMDGWYDFDEPDVIHTHEPPGNMPF